MEHHNDLHWGFAATQTTGNIFGELDQSCGTTGRTVKYIYTATSDGQQTLKAYTGSTFDLEGETSHTGGGSYLTIALTGTTTFTFNQNVVPTC